MLNLESIAGENFKEAITATLKVSGHMPQEGILAVYPAKVIFIYPDAMAQFAHFIWDKNDLKEVHPVSDVGGAALAFQSPEGDVRVVGFGSEEEAAEWQQKLESRLPVPSGNTMEWRKTQAESEPEEEPEPLLTPAEEPPPPLLSGPNEGCEPFVTTRPVNLTDRQKQRVKIGVVAVLVALFLSVGLMVFVLMRTTEMEEDTVVVHAPAVVSKPAYDPVPRGFRGLKFGMNPADVKESLPGLTGWTELEPERVYSFLEIGKVESIPVPGTRVQGKVSVGSEPATCEFVFAVNGRLSRMSCQLDPLPSAEKHEQVEQSMLNALRRRYGPPDLAPEPEQNFGGLREFRDVVWDWEDEGAKLVLRSKFNEFLGITSEIVITNTGAEHQKLIARLEEEAERRAAETQKRIQAEQEEAHRKKVEKLGGQVRSFEDDL
jgi:hypothetical protein